ncbi:hypothetical protein [Halomonas sp. PR-M31]|uniref:hypothetical protein n=1 Tax=Halomonas sp. PR-M31 TaxID=1471202 RepID=UPI00069FF005|nr:hypothetical protein [Halomonas sp. PR-M31]
MTKSNTKPTILPLVNFIPPPFPMPSKNDEPAMSPIWWLNQWMETANSAARLQLIWWDMVGNAMHQEAEFFKIMANSTERMAQGVMNQDLLRDPAAMATHYRQIAKDINEATMNRMTKVSNLSEDFRDRLWEEMC